MKGKVYIRACEKAGLRVENGHGDHVKVYGPVGRGYMTIPNQNRDLATGTDHNIRKWLRLAGVVLTLVLAAVIFLH
jgi:predicted RNA binding protein YcfA (HicA-like mRNA interferase family)